MIRRTDLAMGARPVWNAGGRESDRGSSPPFSANYEKWRAPLGGWQPVLNTGATARLGVRLLCSPLDGLPKAKAVKLGSPRILCSRVPGQQEGLANLFGCFGRITWWDQGLLRKQNGRVNAWGSRPHPSARVHWLSVERLEAEALFWNLYER